MTEHNGPPIAVATGTLSPDTPHALERARDLGFTHVELTLQSAEFDYTFRRRPDVRFYRRLQAQLHDLGLTVCSVTLPPLAPAVAFSPRARREVLLHAAGAAGSVGARVLVLEPAFVLTSDDAVEAYFQTGGAPPVVDGFDELWAQAVNRRLTPALLNGEYFIGQALTNQADRLAQLTADLALGAALDVPQALRRNTPAAWLGALTDRLALAYAYDVDATTGASGPPLRAEWADWLPDVARLRPAGIVVRGGGDSADSDLTTARRRLAELARAAAPG